MTKISSWGRLTRDEHRLAPVSPEHPAIPPGNLPGLPHGMGRSYGDVCLNPGNTLWMTRGLNRWISFDPDTGQLRCQAGTLLGDIQRVMSRRGWMLPVTPGTQFVTVGGAIANDVHGKNHHRVGTFGDHVVSLTLARTDRAPLRCGPAHHPEWFKATVGGLGLTGLITEATLQLRRAGPWLQTELIPFSDLETFFTLADESEAGWEYTVSWLDCLDRKGRGIFMRANPLEGGAPTFAAPQGKALSIPFTPPVSLVNGLSLKPFNTLYHFMQSRKAGPGVSHYLPFFYPLDALHDWNRMYGPRGFYQYQCVVPREAGEQAVSAMLERIARSGTGSFLAVLKTFGQQPPAGMLSFACPGITLALDFPNNGPRTISLFTELDAIVRDTGGRIYPAKDARMSASLFQQGYPLLAEFQTYRDPGIRSALSRRLMEN